MIVSKIESYFHMKEGSIHWWTQRATAVALIPLCLWFYICISVPFDFTYVEDITIMLCLSEGVYSAAAVNLMLIFNVLLFIHIREGMESVFEDYIHGANTKLLAIILLRITVIELMKNIYFFYVYMF